MARGLGPTPCIRIIVAHVCNYNVNIESWTEPAGLCGERQKTCGAGESQLRGGGGIWGKGGSYGWLADVCVITLSCVLLQQCLGGYISGKLLMVVFRWWVQLLILSPGVAGKKYGIMQHCKKNKPLTTTLQHMGNLSILDVYITKFVVNERNLWSTKNV